MTFSKDLNKSLASMSCSELEQASVDVCRETPENPIAKGTEAAKDPRSGGAQVYLIMGQFIRNIEDVKRRCADVHRFCQTKCSSAAQSQAYTTCKREKEESDEINDEHIKTAKEKQNGAGDTSADSQGQEQTAASSPESSGQSDGGGAPGGGAPMMPPQQQAQNEEPQEELEEDNSDDVRRMAELEQDCLARGLKPEASYSGKEPTIRCVPKSRSTGAIASSAVSASSLAQEDTSATLLNPVNSPSAVTGETQSDQVKAVVFEESESDYASPAAFEEEFVLEQGRRWIASSETSDQCRAANLIQEMRNGSSPNSQVVDVLESEMASRLGMSGQDLNDFDLEFACSR